MNDWFRADVDRRCSAPHGETRVIINQSSSDADLQDAMSRYAEGDDDGLSNVYDLSAPQLCSFLTRLCRDHTLAEDLAHETFMRVHGARGSYRRGARVLPWMFAIGRRLFLGHHRSSRHDGAGLDAPTADGDPSAPSPAADDMVVESELAAHIERVLGAMPETQATAFRLLKQEGFSIAEAAAILGTTEMTVKRRLHRVHVALRDALGREWPDAHGSDPARVTPHLDRGDKSTPLDETNRYGVP
jgi:RNA polymerase sigma-70 factor, ECF subfamily